MHALSTSQASPGPSAGHRAARLRLQLAALLPGLASGETIATLAFTEPNGKWDASGITMEATKSGDGYTLNGTKSFVIDGHTANLIIVAARTDGEVSLFAVDGDSLVASEADLPGPRLSIDMRDLVQDWSTYESVTRSRGPVPKDMFGG